MHHTWSFRFFKVYSSVQTIICDYKDATAINGLLIRIQVNPSVGTSVVKDEILSEKKDCYTRAHCSLVPRIRNGSVSRECFVRSA